MVILLALIALISSLAGNGRRYRVRHGAKGEPRARPRARERRSWAAPERTGCAAMRRAAASRQARAARSRLGPRPRTKRRRGRRRGARAQPPAPTNLTAASNRRLVDDAMKCGSWCQMGTSILVIALMWLMLACVVALIAIWTAFMLGCLSGDNGSSLAMGCERARGSSTGAGAYGRKRAGGRAGAQARPRARARPQRAPGCAGRRGWWRPAASPLARLPLGRASTHHPQLTARAASPPYPQTPKQNFPRAAQPTPSRPRLRLRFARWTPCLPRCVARGRGWSTRCPQS